MESFDVKMMKWLTCRVPSGHEATSKVGRENLLENKINKKYMSEIHVPESYWSKNCREAGSFFFNRNSGSFTWNGLSCKPKNLLLCRDFFERHQRMVTAYSLRVLPVFPQNFFIKPTGLQQSLGGKVVDLVPFGV